MYYHRCAFMHSALSCPFTRMSIVPAQLSEWRNVEQAESGMKRGSGAEWRFDIEVRQPGDPHFRMQAGIPTGLDDGPSQASIDLVSCGSRDIVQQLSRPILPRTGQPTKIVSDIPEATCHSVKPISRFEVSRIPRCQASSRRLSYSVAKMFLKKDR